MHLHISNRNGSCTNPIDYKNNAIANAKCVSAIYQLYLRNIPQRIVAIYLVLDVGLLFSNNGALSILCQGCWINSNLAVA